LEDSTFIITQNNASLPADTRDLDGDSNITEAIPLNIARNPRVNGTNVDLGAFKFVQNSAPVLYDTTLTVPENSLLNTLVGTITPTDADNNPLTYSITDMSVGIGSRERGFEHLY
jgi:hypothetical protein